MLAAAAVAAWATAAPPVPATAAPETEFKIIVHPDNPVGAVEVSFLRDVYLKKTVSWGHGRSARPIDLSPVRERFAAKVLRKTPSQLRYYWNGRVFSGKGVPPPQVDSVAAAVEYVIEHPGAVAYLPADADTGDAKVIELR